MTYTLIHPTKDARVGFFGGSDSKDRAHKQAIAWAKRYKKNVRLEVLSSHSKGPKHFLVTAGGRWVPKYGKTVRDPGGPRFELPVEMPPRERPTPRREPWRNRLKGGLADKRTPKDFNPRALRQGMRVEREHTTDRHLQKEIAMDHLTEDPHYYTKLALMEKGYCKKPKKRGKHGKARIAKTLARKRRNRR